MYTAFTDEQVFLNADVNVFCNLFYEEIINIITDSNFVENVAIIGTLAEIIDGAPLEELTVVQFGVKAEMFFDQIKNDIAERVGAVSVVYPARVQMIWKEVYFEIWHKPDMAFKVVNGLQIEDLS